MNLKQFRIDNNIKQGELALLLRCSQVFISNVEKGLKVLPPGKLDMLKSLYGDIINPYLTMKITIDNEVNSTAAPVDVNSDMYRLLDKMLSMLDEKDSQIKSLIELTGNQFNKMNVVMGNLLIALKV
jgi:hypothetical protein